MSFNFDQQTQKSDNNQGLLYKNFLKSRKQLTVIFGNLEKEDRDSLIKFPIQMSSVKILLKKAKIEGDNMLNYIQFSSFDSPEKKVLYEIYEIESKPEHKLENKNICKNPTSAIKESDKSKFQTFNLNISEVNTYELGSPDVYDNDIGIYGDIFESNIIDKEKLKPIKKKGLPHDNKHDKNLKQNEPRNQIEANKKLREKITKIKIDKENNSNFVNNPSLDSPIKTNTTRSELISIDNTNNGIIPFGQISKIDSNDENAHLIFKEEINDLNISEIAEIKNEYLINMADKYVVAKYYHIFKLMLFFSYGLLIKISLVAIVHLLNLNFTASIIFNIYVLSGYSLVSMTYYICYVGITSIRSYKFLKLESNNWAFISCLIINICILVMANVKFIVGNELYSYLHSDDRFIYYYSSFLLALIFSFIVNSIMLSFYKEYYNLFPFKEKLLKNIKKVNI